MDLIELNRRGLIPFPEETEVRFFARARGSAITASCPADPLGLFSSLFDAEPNWVRIDCCNKGLSIWEGAATWQEIASNKTITPSIQIRKKTLIPFSATEAIAHELVHAVRLGFREDQFEEILAYQTSKVSWRKYFGPFFQKPYEMGIFLFFLLFSLSIQWLDVFFDLPALLSIGIALPWLLLSIGAVRLYKNQRLFKHCLQRISQMIGSNKSSLAVALRLTDAEICLFARSSPSKIKDYIESQASMRWKMITQAYFCE